MNRRALLRKHFLDAWKSCINEDYRQQRINSERSLQASLWSRLNSKLPPKNRRMFIEPCLQIKANKESVKKHPDLVICNTNTREVICIVELKYQPRVKPDWKKDIDTFKWIIVNRDKLFVSNTRFRGLETDNKTYQLSKDILFVWAGIHTEFGIKLKEKLDLDLQ